MKEKITEKFSYSDSKNRYIYGGFKLNFINKIRKEFGMEENKLYRNRNYSTFNYGDMVINLLILCNFTFKVTNKEERDFKIKNLLKYENVD